MAEIDAGIAFPMLGDIRPYQDRDDLREFDFIPFASDARCLGILMRYTPRAGITVMLMEGFDARESLPKLLSQIAHDFQIPVTAFHWIDHGESARLSDNRNVA